MDSSSPKFTINKPEVPPVSFTAAPVEVERARHWAKGHSSEVRHHKRRDIEWRFVGTSIGVAVKVTCLTCKQSLDVTDYESW